MEIQKVYSLKHFFKFGYPQNFIHTLRKEGYLKPYIYSGARKQTPKFRECDFITAINDQRRDHEAKLNRCNIPNDTFDYRTKQPFSIKSLLDEWENENKKKLPKELTKTKTN